MKEPLLKSSDWCRMLDKKAQDVCREDKPTKEAIAAARAVASLSNSRLGHFKVTMEYDRRNGRKPRLPGMDLHKAK